MVMVSLANGIEAINGQEGGNIWRYDVCGHHIQAAPRHIKRFKPLIQRKAFTEAKNAWKKHRWTLTEINSWHAWSMMHPSKNKKGETVYYTLYGAFLSVNIKRILAGKEIIFLPP